MKLTLLSQIQERITVDVDSMDPAVASRHSSFGYKFCDMTSNQAIVYNECIRHDRQNLVKSAVEHVRVNKVDESSDQFIPDVIDVVTVLLAKQVYPYLSGRVHAQTSPGTAYDTAKTVEHATKLVETFEAHGIPRERVCIKIPSTPESLLACQILEQSGIRTLATCLFSVPQALAASEAGCLYIAPYFNELRVHFEDGAWIEYKDTAAEHPMCAPIHQIVGLFEAIGSKTLVMPASIVTTAEVVALASLKPNHLTLSGAVLDKLHSAEVIPEIPAGVLKENSVDIKEIEGRRYLDNDGKLLRESLSTDTETSRKLASALTIFGEMESKTKAYIKQMM